MPEPLTWTPCKGLAAAHLPGPPVVVLIKALSLKTSLVKTLRRPKRPAEESGNKPRRKETKMKVSWREGCLGGVMVGWRDIWKLENKRVGEEIKRR